MIEISLYKNSEKIYHCICCNGLQLQSGCSQFLNRIQNSFIPRKTECDIYRIKLVEEETDNSHSLINYKDFNSTDFTVDNVLDFFQTNYELLIDSINKSTEDIVLRIYVYATGCDNQEEHNYDTIVQKLTITPKELDHLNFGLTLFIHDVSSKMIDFKRFNPTGLRVSLIDRSGGLYSPHPEIVAEDLLFDIKAFEKWVDENVEKIYNYIQTGEWDY